jgi:outer membrane lipoprotein SlyB
MKSKQALTIALLALLAPACATTTTSSATWGQPAPQDNWVMYGHVESVRENVVHEHGDPGSGAVAGFGTFFGAAEGAAIGANASQGGYVGRVFEVFVRFDDGSLRPFSYQDQLPFRPGDYVVWTPQGLAHR